MSSAHALTEVEVDGREMLVQTSIEWGTKEDKTLRLRTNTRNTRYGTATPISVINIGSHQQDPERSRRTFYRTAPDVHYNYLRINNW